MKMVCLTIVILISVVGIALAMTNLSEFKNQYKSLIKGYEEVIEIQDSVNDRLRLQASSYWGQVRNLKYYLTYPDEFDILCRTVSGESGGQSQVCQQMVAETIMNKVDTDAISRGNAIRSVVYAPNAFVVADCLNKFEPSEITRKACIDAILSDERTDALYFCSASVEDADFQIRFIKPLEKVAEVDGMKFWRVEK